MAAEGINERLEGDAVDGVSIVVGNVASPWLKGSDQPNSSHRASVRVHLNRKPPRKVSIDEVERVWRNSVGNAFLPGTRGVPYHPSERQAERRLCT